MTQLHQRHRNSLNRLRPNQIVVRLRVLIQLYLHQHSRLLAKSVSRHIQALLVHPDYDIDPKQRCNLRRLEAHWRCLAWLGNQSVVAIKQTKLSDNELMP